MNFYSVISKAYDLLDILFFSEKGHNPRDIINSFIIGESPKIVDLCCGTLSNSIHIAKSKPDCRIIGVDLSKQMLGTAARKKDKLNLNNIKLRCADARDTKLPCQYFDYAVIGLVLHECSTELIAGIMKEAYRVLKDNGKLIILEWEKQDSLIRRLKFSPLHLAEIINNQSFNDFYYADKQHYFDRYGFKEKETVHCSYTLVSSYTKRK